MDIETSTHRYGTDDSPQDRAWAVAVVRGALHRCPACGRGALYRAYLKPADACPACGEALFHQRATMPRPM